MDFEYSALAIVNALRFSAPTAAALRALLPGTYSDDDLARTYAFEHELNQSRILAHQKVEQDGSAVWRIEFLDAAAVPVTEGGAGRAVRGNITPWSDRRQVGVVCANTLLIMCERHRRKRFARELYASEDALHKRWGIREVQMTAQWDGLHVWIKSFGFLPRYNLKADFTEWAMRSGVSATWPENPAQLPRAFLESMRMLDLYKVV